MDREFMRDTVLVVGAIFAYFVWSIPIQGGWWLLFIGLAAWFTYDLSVALAQLRKRRH